MMQNVVQIYMNWKSCALCRFTKPLL